MERKNYDHYIPQFLLRNFSNYSDLLATGLPEKRAKQRCKVSFLNLEDGKISDRKVANVFGEQNMYVDKRIEDKLGKLEEKASKILREIRQAFERGEREFSLTREDKNELRRFLFIMLYRNQTLKRRYPNSSDEYNGEDKELLLDHMLERKVESPEAIWIQNIETFLETPISSEGAWKEKSIPQASPGEAMRLLAHMNSTFLSFCCPEDPSSGKDEFFITENAYSIYEGPNDPSCWTDCHVFAPVTPKLMIVMRQNFLQKSNHPEEEMKRAEICKWIGSRNNIDNKEGDPKRLSILMDLPLERPRVVYCGNQTSAGSIDAYSSQDTFIFKFAHLGTKQLQLVNTIFLEEAVTTKGIVFKDRQKFRTTLEHYFTANPGWFKTCYSDKQHSKNDTPIPSSMLGSIVWKLEGMEGYLKLLETAAITLGSSVQAKYFDLKLLNHIPQPSPDFIRRYEILGGRASAIAVVHDLAQGNAITNLVTLVDRLIKDQPPIFKSTGRHERTKLILELPVRRLWLHMRQLRIRIKSPLTKKAEEECVQCVNSEADGLEDALIDAYHIFDPVRFAEVMHRLWSLHIFLYLNPLCGTTARSQAQEIIFHRPGTILECGIPKVEREAKRLYPMCQEQTIRTTQISDPDIWLMGLELSLRKHVYARFESLLANDLNLVQIRALKVTLFDNFLRTDLKLKS